MKRCPECAENVQTEARKCRYCGSALAVDDRAVAAERQLIPLWAGGALLAGYFFVDEEYRLSMLTCGVGLALVGLPGLYKALRKPPAPAPQPGAAQEQGAAREPGALPPPGAVPERAAVADGTLVRPALLVMAVLVLAAAGCAYYFFAR